MNLLIVGSGKGSWIMRGQQLGAALGARVTSHPTDTDWRWADLAILVKREAVSMAARARQWSVPIVWDALDFWRQPAENGVSTQAAINLALRAKDAIRPALMIAATQAMAQDIGGVYLPHHGRMGLAPTPAREAFRVIGYDGNPAYLERWEPALRALCAARGWRFVVNPPDLSAVDLLVALRGGPWDGWMCREWKSGVKAVNAILAGRPLVTQDSAAWRELAPAGTLVERLSELAEAIDEWGSYERRQVVVDASHARAEAFSLRTIAARYLQILSDQRVMS